MGLFDRGVAKTKQSFFQKVSRAIVGKSRVDDSVLDAMEEALVATDMGVDTTLKIIDNLQDRVEKDKYMSMEELVDMLKDEIAVIAYDWFDDPAKQYMAKAILAVNPHEQTAYLRKRDKARFKALVARHKRVMAYYKANRAAIEARYAESAKTLKTEAFWKNYLKMS